MYKRISNGLFMKSIFVILAIFVSEELIEKLIQPADTNRIAFLELRQKWQNKITTLCGLATNVPEMTTHLKFFFPSEET